MSLDSFFKNKKATSVILLGASTASLAQVSSNQTVSADVDVICGVLFFAVPVYLLLSLVFKELVGLDGITSFATAGIIMGIAAKVFNCIIKRRKSQVISDSYKIYRKSIKGKDTKNYVLSRETYGTYVWPSLVDPWQECSRYDGYEEEKVVGHEANYMMCGDYSSLGETGWFGDNDCSFGLVHKRYLELYKKAYEQGLRYFGFKIKSFDKEAILYNDPKDNGTATNELADKSEVYIFNIFSQKDRIFYDNMRKDWKIYFKGIHKKLLKSYLRYLMDKNKRNERAETTFEDYVQQEYFNRFSSDLIRQSDKDAIKDFMSKRTDELDQFNIDAKNLKSEFI